MLTHSQQMWKSVDAGHFCCTLIGHILDLLLSLWLVPYSKSPPSVVIKLLPQWFCHSSPNCPLLTTVYLPIFSVLAMGASEANLPSHCTNTCIQHIIINSSKGLMLIGAEVCVQMDVPYEGPLTIL